MELHLHSPYMPSRRWQAPLNLFPFMFTLLLYVLNQQQQRFHKISIKGTSTFRPLLHGEILQVNWVFSSSCRWRYCLSTSGNIHTAYLKERYAPEHSHAMQFPVQSLSTRFANPIAKSTLPLSSKSKSSRFRDKDRRRRLSCTYRRLYELRQEMLLTGIHIISA